MSKKRKKSHLLDLIYKKIPNSNCKGLCQDSCGPIGFTRLERDRMTSASGKEPFLQDGGSCGYLVDGKCSVYSVRPGICRLYGSTEELRCSFGCEPDKMLSEPQSQNILAEIDIVANKGDYMMKFNITKDQALNMKLGRVLSAPTSNLVVKDALDIVPFKK